MLRRASAVLFLAFCSLGATNALGQRDVSRAVLAATLREVHASLQRSDEARIRGPIALDPRLLRTEWGGAPVRWPDSLTLQWMGDVREGVLPPEEVASLLREMNGSRGPVHWLRCDPDAEALDCALDTFPAVVSVSEPWISGDAAQVLVLVWYRSTIDLHPRAWVANVLRLQRVDGAWRVTGGHNQAGS